jgi:hypothetical protein
MKFQENVRPFKKEEKKGSSKPAPGNYGPAQKSSSDEEAMSMASKSKTPKR